MSPVALGPRRSHATRPLSAQRASILSRLQDQPDPLSQAALTSITGLHPNTIREHLVGLLRAGLIHRFTEEPDGRGRPAWLYEARDEPQDNEYAHLASALAESLTHTSEDAAGAGMQAGLAWGRSLAKQRTVDSLDSDSGVNARTEVVNILDDLRFEPTVDPAEESVVRLTRCPLLEAAHRYPDVVCGVHLGVVRGALEELGGSPENTGLVPFAEPGACLLTLGSA